MEDNEIMENEEIVEDFEEIEDTEEGANPLVVAGAFAAGVAAVGFGKFVVYDKLLKPGAAKVKNKLANAKEEYQARKAEKSNEIIIPKPIDVVDVEESEKK